MFAFGASGSLAGPRGRFVVRSHSNLIRPDQATQASVVPRDPNAVRSASRKVVALDFVPDRRTPAAAVVVLSPDPVACAWHGRQSTRGQAPPIRVQSSGMSWLPKPPGARPSRRSCSG
jgi:hypothetical protein